jgi:hypothetical protein
MDDYLYATKVDMGCANGEPSKAQVRFPERFGFA